MKKLIITALFFGLGIIIFPSAAKAQVYSPYIYMNNALGNYAMASQRARQMGRKRSTHKSKKRTIRKSNKSKRTSLLEKMDSPKNYGIDIIERKNIVV